MAITFDPAKNARNIAERGLSFERVAGLDWDTAVIIADTRRDYGEPRLRVMVRLDGRLHAVVVTPRGEDLRVIGLRRASRREVRRYGKKEGG
ncbi:MAG TPA: BrnT family toxin [Stellaceae bacterium]|nr:BrnT family toxin [Stellaceae bacterium]